MSETAYKSKAMQYGDLGLVVECEVVFHNKRDTWSNLREKCVSVQGKESL
jgi:hypothetical protein